MIKVKHPSQAMLSFVNPFPGCTVIMPLHVQYTILGNLQVEQLGCEGKVEEAQGVMKLCDQLKNEREMLQMVR